MVSGFLKVAVVYIGWLLTETASKCDEILNKLIHETNANAIISLSDQVNS